MFFSLAVAAWLVRQAAAGESTGPIIFATSTVSNVVLLQTYTRHEKGRPYALASPSTPSSTSTLAFVVNNFRHSKDISWINDALANISSSLVRVDEVDGEDWPRSVSEAGPWLQWILQNYDNLPDFVAFLHGDQHSWHSDLDVHRILRAKPPNVEMLSTCKWGAFNAWDPEPYKIFWGRDVLYTSLFGLTFRQAWDKWHMGGYRCCSENLVAASAIRAVDRVIYQAVFDAMLHTKEMGWGWIFEGFWQNMFSQPHLPTAQVLANFQSVFSNYTKSEPPSLITDVTIHTQRSHCP